MKRPTRRGSAIVFALLICILLAVVGLYLIGARRGAYANARAAVHQAQARALAQAGMEDMMVKLAKDSFFPTGVPDEQKVFSYQETMTDPDDPDKTLGQYQCTVDRSRERENKIFLLCVGTSGTVSLPLARYRITAILDLRTFETPLWREGQDL